MPKQPNITLYSCDRPSCVNKEYVLPNATASPNWHEVTRVDRNGNQRKILFCESDYQQYLQLAENQDKDYDLWLNKVLQYGDTVWDFATAHGYNVSQCSVPSGNINVYYPGDVVTCR